MAKFDLKSFNPQAFGRYIETIPKTRLNELIKSRALQASGQIRQAFQGQTGTVYAVIPMYGRLDGAPTNYDGATDITATGTTTYEQGVVAIGRAKAWGELDFSEDVTGGAGFMSNVARQVSEYWEDVDQDTLLSVIKVIFSITGTENLKFVNSHTYDISGQADAKNQVVGAATLNTAIQQASGDRKNKFRLVVMHSAVATNLENLKLLEYMKQTDANGIERQLTLGSWNGRAVLIDDGMPALDIPEIPASGNNPAVPGYTKYTTYILGEGAFYHENMGAEVPYEMWRNPQEKGGLTQLITRQRKVFAPYGISFTKSSMASNSPTNSELENGANWTLVNDGSGKFIDHKAIAIARIISRG
jgi:hypothetical protein